MFGCYLACGESASLSGCDGMRNDNPKPRIHDSCQRGYDGGLRWGRAAMTKAIDAVSDTSA